MAKKDKKERSLFYKIVTRTLITIGSILGVVVLVVASYAVYVVASYHRIGDEELEVNDGAIKEEVPIDETLTYTSYNVGFGAYSPDFTFFLDAGYDENNNPTVGKSGKAKDKEEVLKNINGSISLINSLNSDFYAIQEVDVEADRSYKVNQKEMIINSVNNYDNTFAINFDSPFFAYPFFDFHGKSLAGLLTLSKYDISSSERVEYTIADTFSKFFDLDRCFSVNRMNTSNNKELVLINSHMSAYDEGGLIRNKQIQELNEYIVNEYNKGNYVVVGGDFNHDLLTNNPLYPEYNKDNFAYKDMTKQPRPDWVSYMFDDNKECLFDDHFSVYASNNEPSCRDCDVVWDRGYTFVSTVDGFIVSDNVVVNKVETTKVGSDGFAYSDHQPTTLSFTLL